MYVKSLQWKIKLATIRNSLFCGEEITSDDLVKYSISIRLELLDGYPETWVLS